MKFKQYKKQKKNLRLLMKIEGESQDLAILKAQSQILQGSAIKTGLGSLFNTKKMKVDFDVFKSLKRGQALLIDKLQNKQIFLQVYNAKEKKKKGLEK